MKKIDIGIKEFRKKVYGCWLGKSIGGTLGMPYEGRPGPFNLKYYDPVPTEPIPNDDLDLQIMWLMLMRQHGCFMNRVQMSKGWRDHADFPWDEYGVAWSNVSRNIFAPASGHHGNLCGDCMGSPIRSELWATLAAGDPVLAAQLAYNDAIQDHDGEGVWGEIFFATIESAAYIMSDREKLIQLGLSAISKESRTYRAVTSTLDWYEQSRDWNIVRGKILKHFGHENCTDGPQNFAFTILGWLHGKNFGERVCAAANCGQDSDCTAATLGSILGILDPGAIPDKWKKPISPRIQVSPAIKNIDLPATLDELTDLTVELAQKMLNARSASVRLTKQKTTAATAVSFPPLAPMPQPEPNKVILADGDLEISANYSEGLDFIPGKKLPVVFMFVNRGQSPVSAASGLMLPPGWSANKKIGTLRLAPGKSKTVGLSILPSGTTRVHTATGTLFVEAQGVRAEYPVPFIGCWPWTVTINRRKQGIHWLPERTIDLARALNLKPGTRIHLAADFHFSRTQFCRLVLAYHGRAAMTFDGKRVIRYAKGHFLPFPHRTPPKICHDLLIIGGRHRMEIDLVTDANQSNAAVVFADADYHHIIYDITALESGGSMV